METPNLPAVHSDTNEVQAITKEFVLSLFIRMFKALELATGDTATAAMIVEKLTQAFEENPEAAREILTPENITKALELKKKADTTGLKMSDIEKAFPHYIAKIGPFWTMIKTFLP